MKAKLPTPSIVLLQDISIHTMYMLFGQEMDHLSSILYKLDQEVIT